MIVVEGQWIHVEGQGDAKEVSALAPDSQILAGAYLWGIWLARALVKTVERKAAAETSMALTSKFMCVALLARNYQAKIERVFLASTLIVFLLSYLRQQFSNSVTNNESDEIS